jgi:hypothetical protein
MLESWPSVPLPILIINGANDRFAVERQATVGEFIEQTGQGKLRHVKQDVDVLGESRSPP